MNFVNYGSLAFLLSEFPFLHPFDSNRRKKKIFDFKPLTAKTFAQVWDKADQPKGEKNRTPVSAAAIGTTTTTIAGSRIATTQTIRTLTVTKITVFAVSAPVNFDFDTFHFFLES